MWDAASHTSSLCPLVFRAGCQMSICLFYWLVNSIQCKQLFVADLRGLLNYPQERRDTRHLNCQPGWKVGGWKCQRSPSGKSLLLRVAFTQLMTVGVFYVSPPPIYGHWTIGHVIFWFTIQCAVNHCHMVITYNVESTPFIFIDVRD